MEKAGMLVAKATASTMEAKKAKQQAAAKCRTMDAVAAANDALG